MQFIDISSDTKDIYRLTKNEKAVFFMLNRDGELAFELHGKDAEAHIFAFFIGKDVQKKTLKITQKHLARETTSSALVKSALSGDSEFSYEGEIHIAKEASLSDASQESRSLLLSPESKAFARPALEILAHDVKCRHAATMNPLSKDALFFAQARGLTEIQAKKLLLQGFFNEALDRIETLHSDTESIRKKLEAFTG